MYQREIREWEKACGVHRIFLQIAAQNAHNLDPIGDLIYNTIKVVDDAGVLVIWLPHEDTGRYVKWHEKD